MEESLKTKSIAHGTKHSTCVSLGRKSLIVHARLSLSHTEYGLDGGSLGIWGFSNGRGDSQALLQLCFFFFFYKMWEWNMTEKRQN